MQNWIWKIAGTAAAVVTAGAAVALMEKILQKRQDDIEQILEQNRLDQNEETVTPEWEQEVQPSQQAEQAQPAQPPVAQARPVGEDTPNPNPVMAPPAETPRTADGKIDVSKLCDPADFCDWDDLGCKS